MARPSGTGRHDVQRVPDSPHGLPTDIPTSVNNRSADLAVVAITDVHDERRKVRALARIDLLDFERRSGKIDEASFQVGRQIEATFERMSRISGGGQWHSGDRVDGATSSALAFELGYQRSVIANSLLGWMCRHVGRFDTRLLIMLLGDRMPLATTALRLGRPGVRGYRYIHDRFADALAALAEAKAARGRDHSDGGDRS